MIERSLTVRPVLAIGAHHDSHDWGWKEVIPYQNMHNKETEFYIGEWIMKVIFKNKPLPEKIESI